MIQILNENVQISQKKALIQLKVKIDFNGFSL